MSCACKTANRMLKRDGKYSNSSGNSKTSEIIDYIINVLNKLIICILFVIVTPIVILCLIFNLFFKGKLYFKLPNFILNNVAKSENKIIKDNDSEQQ